MKLLKVLLAGALILAGLEGPARAQTGYGLQSR
jgi:hypothetical protein